MITPAAGTVQWGPHNAEPEGVLYTYAAAILGMCHQQQQSGIVTPHCACVTMRHTRTHNGLLSADSFGKACNMIPRASQVCARHGVLLQVRAFEHALRVLSTWFTQELLSRITVSSVDGYQGREADVVLFSAVRWVEACHIVQPQQWSAAAVVLFPRHTRSSRGH